MILTHKVHNLSYSDLTFTEEETLELLKHKIGEPYSGSLGGKINATGLSSEMAKMLPRNLDVLLQNL